MKTDNRNKHSQLQQIETDLLLEAIYRRHGYDFRSYARASIERRIKHFLSGSGCSSIAEMIPRVIHDREFSSRLVQNFSVAVTEFYRDPPVYRIIRDQVVPLLRTWPNIKIWHAGCATGEEVYSLAILLKEEGVYDRTTIYATDFNDDALEKARDGIYEPEKLKEATRNYQQAKGKYSFAEYYLARYDAAVIDASLKERIVFSNHNLATDGVFGEMHLIFCRNVLIYFDTTLQNRVLHLFADSLVHGGFLCLGTKESLRFSEVNDQFEAVDESSKIFKKIRGS